MVVTMDTDMDMLIPNNVERGDKRLQLYSTFAKTKRNVEWLLKQSLKAFKLIQHRFNFVSTRLKGKRGHTVSTSLFNNMERMNVEANVEAVFSGPYFYSL